MDAGHVLPGEQGEGDLAAGQVLHPGFGECDLVRGVGTRCRRPRCPASVLVTSGRVFQVTVASSQVLSATRTSTGSVEPAEDQSVVCTLSVAPVTFWPGASSGRANRRYPAISGSPSSVM